MSRLIQLSSCLRQAKSYSLYLRNSRSLSYRPSGFQTNGLGNPMFPTRAIPEPLIDNVGGDFKSKGKAPDDDSFLAVHGGKIAAGVGIFLVVWIYTYFRGGQLKTAAEESLSESSAIEPHEANEIRYTNELDIELYEDIIKQSKIYFQNFENSSNSKSKLVSYKEFITFLCNYLKDKRTITNEKIKIQSGYLFDRIVARYIFEKTNVDYLEGKNQFPENTILNRLATVYDDSLSAINSSKSIQVEKKWQESPLKIDSVGDIPIELDFLLVMLNLTVASNAEDRARTLMFIPSSNEYNNGNNNNNNNNNIENNMDNNNQNNNNNDSNVTNNSNDVTQNEIRVPKETVGQVIQYLSESCQIPTEKLIGETGQVYPVRTYRKKTPEEMIQLYNFNTKNQNDDYNQYEFGRLLISGSVCAWAECYRKN